MWHWCRTVAVCGVACTVGAPATAQSSHYTSVEAMSGKPLQLGYYASVRKDCAPAPLPSVRVVQAPKSGVLTIRTAVLTTDKLGGCPGLKVPARVLFYQARAGYAGADHVTYEVTTSPGNPRTFDVTITVKTPPSPTVPRGSTATQI